MTVKTYSINTTDGKRYGLMNAKTGDVLRPCDKWKTERGAIQYAKRNGYEIAND